MRNEDQNSSLSSQVERAANEGMVTVAPPRPRGDLEDTRTTVRRLLELQLVAKRAYDKTLERQSGGLDADTISVVAQVLEQDIRRTRAQLWRLDAFDPVEVPSGAEVVDGVTGIAAGMLDEAGTAKGLMVGELALAHTAEAMLEHVELIPSFDVEMRQIAVNDAKARAATLQLIA